MKSLLLVFPLLSIFFLISCDEENMSRNSQLDLCDSFLCGTACSGGVDSECNSDSVDCDNSCKQLVFTAFYRGRICPDQNPKSCNLFDIQLEDFSIDVIGLDIDKFEAKIVDIDSGELFASSKQGLGGIDYDPKTLKANITFGIVDKTLIEKNLKVIVTTLVYNENQQKINHSMEYQFGQGVFVEN